VLKYEDRLPIPEGVSVADVKIMLDKLRERGSADLNPTMSWIGFTVEAEDRWDLREVLADIEREAMSYGFELEVKRDLVSDVTPA
jgi:hypothetical protein